MNACKYAFTDHVFPELTILCSAGGGRLQLVTGDNGPGFGLDVKKALLK